MTKTIGIIGGGQLGLMIAQEAHHLGARVVTLDPDPDAPAFAVSDEHIVAAYDDLSSLEKLGDASDVLTYEFENVPGDILRHLQGKYNIKQGISPLFDSQDRLREKDNAARHGLQTPKYMALPLREGQPASGQEIKGIDEAERKSQLRNALSVLGMPCVLKTRTLGYDGHGQAVIRTEADIDKAVELLNVPCILEAFVDFDYECSVVMVRSAEKTIHFPIGRNIHKDGILDLCIVPGKGMYTSDSNQGKDKADMQESELGKKIAADCARFMEECGYMGILAIELFIKGDSYFFNEMAPRPHNSGHYTIEGCTTNQYRELCRFLLDEPLEEPSLIGPTVMKNILGQDLEEAQKIENEQHSGAFVHLYGKKISRPKRKMGHITYVPMKQEEYEAQWAGRFV